MSVSRSFEDSYGSSSSSHSYTATTNNSGSVPSISQKNTQKVSNSQHSRGRSPTLRGRATVQQQQRDDESYSYISDHDDDGHDAIFGEPRSSYEEDDGGSSSSYYGTSFESEDTWDSDATGGDNSEDAESVVTSFDESELHSDTEEQTRSRGGGRGGAGGGHESDVEYAENKALKNIGKVIKATPTPQYRRQQDYKMKDSVVAESSVDDDDDDEVSHDHSASVFSYDSNTVMDDKSLDSVEQEEFEEFMVKQREKINTKTEKSSSGFFWMLGFGHDEDAETVVVTGGEDSKTTVVDEETIGETTLASLPEEDETDYDEIEDVQGDETTDHNRGSIVTNASEASMIKANQTFETTQVKSGCFIGLMGSHDSIDGSYGGLRDGDILVAESRSLDNQTRPEIVNAAKCSMACAPKTRKSRRKKKKKATEQPVEPEGSGKTDVARVVQETGATAAPVAGPFGLFSYFEPTKTTSTDPLASKDSGLRGEKILLEVQESESIEETMVIHTIGEPFQKQYAFHRKDGKTEEPILRHAISSDEDRTLDGDSTIMTEQLLSIAPNFKPVVQREEPKIPVSLDVSQSASSSIVGSSACRTKTPSPHSDQVCSEQGTDHSRTQYSQDGRKCTVSYHSRGYQNVTAPSDNESTSSSNPSSGGSATTLSYKEEFELELGSYAMTYEDTSSSSNSDGTPSLDGGPRRKKAERLDNYDISEIVHGRRQFMPKPKKTGTLGTAYRDVLRNESTGTAATPHPLNAQPSGARRERRLNALKAHHDFLHGGDEEPCISPTKDPLLLSKATGEDQVAQIFSLQEPIPEDPASLDGCRSLDKVQPSNEWIEKTWLSLEAEEQEKESLGTDAARNAEDENSIAEGQNTTSAEAQKADALFDLVRNAIDGIMDQHATSTAEGNPDQPPVFVPDVFKAAYDFFGVGNQESPALRNIESDAAHEEFKCTGFNPNPRAATLENLDSLPTSAPGESKDHAPALPLTAHVAERAPECDVETSDVSSLLPTDHQGSKLKGSVSSPEVTANSELVVLDASIPKIEKHVPKERFNVDGIPLELRPKKIWKAFDNFSVASAQNDTSMMEKEVREAFIPAHDHTEHESPSSEAESSPNEDASTRNGTVSDVTSANTTEAPSEVTKDDSVSNNDSAPIVNRRPKQAEILRIKSRRAHRVSRITDKRQYATSNKEASDKATLSDEKQVSTSHLPYSSDANGYRQHVMDIRSRLRNRRRTKIFRQSEGNKPTTSKTNTQERRDDSSSNSDEFFDANEKQQGENTEEEVKERGVENRIDEDPYEDSLPSYTPTQYRVAPASIEQQNIPVIEDPMSHDGSEISERSRVSAYSAFSLD
ncbi:MAG: hypothetical protein SGILL_003609 [Bacillariaceae sp.]